MTKKWMAISVLLFIVACLLGWWLHVSIRRFNAENELEKLQPARDMMQKIAQEKSLPSLPPPNGYIQGEFAVIPEKNVFSASRSSEDEATEDVDMPEAGPLLRKPILVGINISDSQKTALLVDPKESSQNRNRPAEIKRIGDVFQGHTITDIAPDYIVLESGSRKEIIPLHEGSKKTAGGRTPILSTRVVSLSGGAVSGGTPIVASPSRVGTAPTAPASGSAPIAASQPKAPSTATAVAISTPSPQPGADESPSQRTQVRQRSPDTGTSSPKTRVIRTPFGDIVRPERD